MLLWKAPHSLPARAKLCLSHLEEKPDCSKARCEVQFSPRCPEDSVLIEGYAPPGKCCPLPSRCVCDPAGCLRKVCQPGYLNILVSKASGKPGECCDLYECKPGMHVPVSAARLSFHVQTGILITVRLPLWARGAWLLASSSEKQRNDSLVPQCLQRGTLSASLFFFFVPLNVCLMGEVGLKLTVPAAFFPPEKVRAFMCRFSVAFNDHI